MENITVYSVTTARDWDGDPGFCWGVYTTLDGVIKALEETLQPSGDAPQPGFKEAIQKWWPGPTVAEEPSRPDRDFVFASPDWDEDRFIIVSRHTLNE